MPKNKDIIAVAPIHRVMKEVSTTRVSKKAAATVAVFMLQHAQRIAKKAIANSRHAGRSTVLTQDIQLSLK